ncbi:MAG TPA: M48 family metalloprotease [Gammaproteobacteria bacterium]|nr:M48 family metalloprotease [Gammaproteobacteria bacterium]
MNARFYLDKMRYPLALVLMLALTACANVNGGGMDVNSLFNTFKTVKQAVTPANQQEEEQIGYATASTLLGAAKPINDPAVQEYVNKVGLWVALQSDRPDLPWHFAVVDSNDIDAFAVPGGYVFITRGLLLHMRSEAELAGALGHEISHVVLKQQLKALQQAAQLNLVGQAAQFELQQHGQNTQFFDSVAGATRNLYSKGLDKDDEFEADRMGVVLAARAGYDPYGLVAVLQTLETVDPKSNGMQLLLATHPAPAARVAMLSAEMQAGHMDRYGRQVEGTERYQQMIKTLVSTSTRR